MPAYSGWTFGWLVAAGALLSAPLAHAQTAAATATATASVTDFGWTLSDLDVNDGITPELTLITGAGQTTTSSHYTASGVTRDRREAYGETALTDPAGYARTRFSPTDSYAWAEAEQGAPRHTFDAHNLNWFNFRLTPNSALTFEGQGEVAAAGPAVPSAFAMVRMLGYVVNTRGEVLSSFWLTMDAPGGATTQILRGVISTGADAANGRFELHVIANATAASPVPEPSAHALLLAGLALIGWRRRLASR